MKKLYGRGTVHPSPPITTDHLSFLPAAILTLAAALSAEEREVLAYLISCSNNDFGNFSSHGKSTQKYPATRNISFSSGSDHDHPPIFTCDCFRCYMSYWVRWDSSPNRQLIHEIIDAFEDGLAQSQKTKSKKDMNKKNGGTNGSGGLKRADLSFRKDESNDLKSVEASSSSSSCGGEVCGDDGEEEGTEKGTVRRFVNFIGERIWNVWGQ
ncbi:hypothetical protein F3Y22_tig00004205pilonHSYRG00055 [Hibiscus syriacus]|uniref:Uncharacterized protein n=1 Tax=Hibiscus syriacus TaxID=106335 RepID=A0A6A3CNB8_HIBSY|nr:uncharacterized protein LOC120192227 [Hibiscus syriacus]KAE8728579.1 hypothetical protein F3Y22_tig00004205pilonHSYRG00055 [Hibiscus syriacus]